MCVSIWKRTPPKNIDLLDNFSVAAAPGVVNPADVLK
jgi:hypothetical protein